MNCIISNDLFTRLGVQSYKRYHLFFFRHFLIVFIIIVFFFRHIEDNMNGTNINYEQLSFGYFSIYTWNNEHFIYNSIFFMKIQFSVVLDYKFAF